jgi:hypothetical protein
MTVIENPEKNYVYSPLFPIIQANKMHYLSTLSWWGTFHISDGILSIIRTLDTVFTAIGICHAEILKMGKITGVHTCILLLNFKTCCWWNSMLYKKLKIVKTFQKMQHALQFNNNVHVLVYTLAILPIFKISVWQMPIALNTVLRLLMMDSKSVQRMYRSLPK